MFPLLSSLQVKHFSLNQQSQSHDILDSICLCISLLITFKRRCSCEKFGGIVWISVYSIFRVLSCSHPHASKVMLKILQARLQQYANRELPDVHWF